jgi:hypothetical protein
VEELLGREDWLCVLDGFDVVLDEPLERGFGGMLEGFAGLDELVELDPLWRDFTMFDGLDDIFDDSVKFSRRKLRVRSTLTENKALFVCKTQVKTVAVNLKYK